MTNIRNIKFTGGDWEVERLQTGEVFITSTEQVESTFGTICDFYCNPTGQQRYAFPNAQQNAELMAAAPRLLKALIDVETIVRYGHPHDALKVIEDTIGSRDTDGSEAEVERLMQSVSPSEQQRTLVQRAREFAVKMHAKQVRDDGEPYEQHLLRVASRVARQEGRFELIAAAWLHDVVEDCCASPEQQAGMLDTIQTQFGPYVASVVQQLTVPYGLKGQAKRDHQLAVVPLYAPDVLMVKLADRLDNITDMRTWTEDRRRQYVQHTEMLLDILPPIPKSVQYLYDDLRNAVRVAKVALKFVDPKENP